MPNHFLIKRSPAFSNTGLIEKKNQKNKSYSETLFTDSQKQPLPKDLKVGDTIYVAETGWGIYATGKVTSVIEPEVCTSIEEILKLASSRKPKDEKYWLDKITRFHQENILDSKPKLAFKFQEYFIDQKLLDRPLPLIDGLARLSQKGLASAIIKLTDEEVAFIQKPNYQPQSFALSTNIPYALKLDLYGFFNTNCAVQHFVDIDHFVPQSIKGPGNIIENLVPIGLGLNRYKSNSIPKGLFLEAMNHSELNQMVKKELVNSKEDFLTDKDAKDLALKITTTVNDWNDLNKIRAFYRSVLQHHFVDYVRILDEYRQLRGY